MDAPRRFPDPPLFVITDDDLDATEICRRVASACEEGCRAVQLRHRFLPTRRLLDLATELRRTTLASGSQLIVNDRVDIAVAVDADGVHLPASGMSPKVARRIVGERMLVGLSVHSIEEITEAAGSGIDYFQFGPVYDTPSKRRYGPAQGTAGLGRAVESAGAEKIVAVGGVTAERILDLKLVGAAGVAVIGAVMAAPDAGEATAALLRALARST
ncbi:MAG: thiamine phosphate synthase [Candidatus Binatia bacterium]